MSTVAPNLPVVGGLIRRLRRRWDADLEFRRAKDILRYPLHHGDGELSWAQDVINARGKEAQ